MFVNMTELERFAKELAREHFEKNMGCNEAIEIVFKTWKQNFKYVIDYIDFATCYMDEIWRLGEEKVL